MKKTIIATVIGTFSFAANAEPVTAFIAYIGSSISTAVAYMGTAQFWGQVALAVVATAYTSAVARRNARRAAAAARDEYNASLEERAVTALGASPAWRVVYGRSIVGGDVVAMFTTDKVGTDDKGKSYTKKDGYKHIVIRIADHQVKAIHGAYWGGVRVGPLTEIGEPTYAPGNGGIPVGQTADSGWATAWIETRTAVIRGDTKMPYKVLGLLSAIDSTGADRLADLTLTTNNTRVVGPTNERIKVTYEASRSDFVKDSAAVKTVAFTHTRVLQFKEKAAAYIVDAYSISGDPPTAAPVVVTISENGRVLTSADTTGTTYATYGLASSTPRIKLSFHTGEDGQTVDAYLNSLMPDVWTENHRLDGKAYAIATLDLEDNRFQGGASELSFDVSGRLMFDPRTGQRTWSSNNALVANDFLTSRWGHRCDQDEIDTSYLIAAANACDETLTFTETDSEFGTVTTSTGPRYTFNGPFNTDESKDNFLGLIAESMAGSIVDSAAWLIMAGVWTPPIRDLEDSDLAGSVEIVQGDNGIDDTFNAVRGRYIPSGFTAPTDFTPYRNTVLIGADGEELYDNVEYPYTDSNARCLNLARTHTELSRTGLVIRYPAKVNAWRVQIGDRVRVNGTDFNFNYKKFRVTDWQHTLKAPVELLLQEDEPESYDTIDTAVSDPTKDITLANPWEVQPITGVTVSSGTAHLIKNNDGTLSVRAFVTYNEPEDSYVGKGSGRVEIQYRHLRPKAGVDEAYWTSAGSDTDNVRGAYIYGLSDGDLLLVRVFAVNSIGIEGSSEFVSHTVVGKTEPPSDVQDLTVSYPGVGALLKWKWPSDLDYSETLIQLGSWNDSAVNLFEGKVTEFPYQAEPGTYNLFVKHRDTSKNVSVNAATIQVIIDADSGTDSRPELVTSPTSGTIYTDYRGVVNNFSQADAQVVVRDQSGTDLTSAWTITKVDTNITSTLVDGQLEITGYDLDKVDPGYAASVIRAPFNGTLADASSQKVLHGTSGDVTVSSTGGPFPGTGFVSFGSSDAYGGHVLAYGFNTALIPGPGISWSMSAWIMLTQYPQAGSSFPLFGGYGRSITLQRVAFFDPNTQWFFTAGYQGKSPGTQSGLAVSVNSSTLTSANLPLNTWLFLEFNWNHVDRRVRIFLNGSVVGVSAQASTDIAPLIGGYLNPINRPACGIIALSGSPAFKLGRISDFDYTKGASVRTANYTPPTSHRSVDSYLTSASVALEATSGTSVLRSEYSINTIRTPPAVVQVRMSRSAGFVNATYKGVPYSYDGAQLTLNISVDGVDNSSSWAMSVEGEGESNDISFNVVDKTVTVTGMETNLSSAPILIVLSHPLHQTQLIRYPVSMQKDAAPVVMTRGPALVSIAGATDGVVPSSSLPELIVVTAVHENSDITSSYTWSVSQSAGLTLSANNSASTSITGVTQAFERGIVTFSGTSPTRPTISWQVSVVKTKFLRAIGPVKNLDYLSVSAYNNTPGSVVFAKVKYLTDGRIQQFTTFDGWTEAGNWYYPTTPGIGAGYAVKFANGNATWDTTDAPLADVWASLNVDREYGVRSLSYGSNNRYTSTSNLTIRTIASNPVTVAQGPVNLMAETNV